MIDWRGIKKNGHVQLVKAVVQDRDEERLEVIRISSDEEEGTYTRSVSEPEIRVLVNN